MKPANNLETGMMASTNVETYKLATYNTCNSTFFFCPVRFKWTALRYNMDIVDLVASNSIVHNHK